MPLAEPLSSKVARAPFTVGGPKKTWAMGYAKGAVNLCAPHDTGDGDSRRYVTAERSGAPTGQVPEVPATINRLLVLVRLVHTEILTRTYDGVTKLPKVTTMAPAFRAPHVFAG